MATKEELQAREADCSSAADFAALARDVGALDADYARSLLEKAEMQCQMPLDYIATAEAAVALGHVDHAKDLYEQAEDACFESMEFAALGASLARTGSDVDKGREMLEKAAGEASKLNELLTISGYAREALGDEALAAALLAKVEEKAKTLDDYLDLVKTLKAEGADEAAAQFYAKAARYCDDLDATVAYARGYQDLLGDAAGAKKVLEDAETDCQFPKDFAALATGFKELLGDQAKVADLMEQAGEFAMSGEEFLDLARGYWNLLADKDKAVEAFEQALPDTNDKAQLMELAGFIAGQVQAPELARQFYAKAESKMTAAPERLKLAEAVISDTGDKALAGEIYARAAEALTQPNDLMSVAASVADRLGDKATAAQIYRKAMQAMSDLGQYFKLLEAVDEKLGDKAFAREVLASAAGTASGTPELLDVTSRTIRVLDDRDAARPSLAAAEEQVTSVGEMKNVVALVREHYAADAEWVAVVEEKLARREANQAKYAVFQDREKQAVSSVKIMHLADAVMAELDDKFYAKKLLVDAQKKLEDEGWDFSKVRRLVAGVGQHLQDTDWAQRLIKDAAARMQGFAGVASVAESAAQLLPDADTARATVQELLADWGARLDGLADKSAYDYSKLAAVKGRLLGDTEAAAADLDQAATLAETEVKSAGNGSGAPMFAELARVARELGLEDRAQTLLGRARDCCGGSAREARALASRLLEDGFDREQVKQLFGELKGRMADSAQRLGWSESIVDLFGDRAWAGNELAELETQVEDALRPLVRKVRQRRVGRAA
ncbi:hypothetical protein F2Q65_08995 [Thiohalocapsa marina]|uniref:Tetratricopeptide repeat protein n=1 Tax=Thiohalocapsa marina TaxID=424902 RepID=A0A5M8FN28_9GAMM|nr:hypothetical protein [Thiohalocapsa marina]KAA6185400.1 hypothetical protein F2Q65_08995 [Thiohalocapsa marina]